MPEHKLLYLTVISYVSLIVNAPRIKPCPAHSPSSASYQDHLEAFLRTCIVNKTLYQRVTPIVGNFLCVEIPTQVEVPHILGVNRRAAPNIHVFLILRPACASLCVSRQIKVDCVEESLSEIFLELLDDLSGFLLIFIIIKLKGNYFDVV